MRLSHRDALRVLGCNVDDDFEGIKRAYRRACAAYHPDRNPAGLEMMKIVNAAYSALSDYVPGDHRGDNDTEGYGDLGEELNTALNAIIGLGLEIEICGSWIWVSGDTKPHREILKAAGYKWAPKKLMWSYSPVGKKTWSRGKWDMDQIRSVHGSVSVRAREYTRISA